ncbi:hypothetical protein P389DRAFT_55928 [Cystobasidium minutum MCA 4210]|uniref:uncharacterized protein n=1 Tax=Cystobasidium minutum MCA 4210 TaxID=1397322 RepID=UPI0034CFAF26|eukprot:jgi/Rhomi1/55928/CE55927_351
MVTAKSAASKKRRSSAAEATTNADVVAAVKSSSKTGTKKRKVASTTTSAPPLTAVAARRLAAEQQLALQKQQEEEASKQEASTAADAEDAASQNSEAHIEDSDQEEDIDESEDDDEGPIASTSREPYDPDIKFHDGPPKRYFLGGAASLNSSGAASPINVEDNEIEEASFAVSEGEYINTGGDISRAESVTYSKRPSRRRRRAENAANFYLDPVCASTWRPSSDNHVRRSHTDGTSELVIGLYPGETIVLRGCCSLKVIKGSISIACATIDASSSALPIFAPSTHALPTIRALRAQSSPVSDSVPSESSISELEQLIILTLSSISAGIENIESICRLAGMPIPSSGMWHVSNRWSSASQADKESFKILLEPERDLCASVIPHNWLEALEQLGDTEPSSQGGANGLPSYIVQGPKGVGKSTFSKLLVNTLLSSHNTVAFLDCDLGQPEFTPSGCLSLTLVTTPILGPSFTHLNTQPVRMHYLGSATPKDDPAYYIWAISDLLQHYTNLNDEAGTSAIPLVINTQGWYKGLGADLLLEIHRMAQPSVCFDFAAGGAHAASDFQEGLIAAGTAIVDPAAETKVSPTQAYVMPANAPPRLNASDLRILQTISYFHLTPASFPSSSNPNLSTPIPAWDFSTSLVARPPFAVPFSAFRSIKVAVSEHVAFADLLRALDVSIVGLQRVEEVTIDDSAATSSGQEESALRTAYELGVHQQQQAGGHTVGLGIIRSIDVQTQSFHVLTPVPHRSLEQVNAITKGDIELPTVMMVNYSAGEGVDEVGLLGTEWKRVPYLEYGENHNAGVGHGKRRIRRNVMRRSQFK